MTEQDNKTPPSHNNGPKTPQKPTNLFTLNEQIQRQMLATLVLVNLLLLGSIGALFLKLGWLAILAIF